MTSSLRTCDPELRRYLLKHHLPDLFESLLTALTVNKPQDGRQFIIDTILRIQNEPNLLETLRWDTFIDDDKRPANRMNNVSFSWGYEDENTKPSWEMLQRAYAFYNRNLLRLCYGGLYAHWRYRVDKRVMLDSKMVHARKYHDLRMCGITFRAWLEWKRKEKRKQDVFVASLTKVFNEAVERLVFKAWANIAAEAKRTREYFERIERGDLLDSSEMSGEKKDHISLLPRAISVRIFMFLKLPDLVTCSKICRSWKEITQANLLWSRIDLANSDQYLISSKAISILIHKCRPFICHLNLRGCDFFLPRTLKMIADCKNLQDLNLSQCKAVADDVIKEISLGCSSLLYVNISDTEISDASLRYLSRNCNSLQYLNMAHCQSITNRGLHYLSSGKGSQKLVYLDLTACDQITRDGYKVLSKGCIRLNTILLNELPSLTDDCIEALMSECRNLKCLTVLHSPLLTDASLKFISNSRRMQVLRLEGNTRMTDASIKNLVKNCHELRHLYFVDVHRVTDLSLKALSQSRNLMVLNFADCVRISDTGVRYVVEGSSGTRIRELNLTNCIRVSDVSLLRISQRCHNLMYANFSYCEHITDAGIELLSSIPTLISLDISGCNITDSGAVALGNIQGLRDINISECSNISDVGFQKMCPHVKSLENLDISHLNQITDQTIKTLAFCCRRLRVLNLSGCHLITDQSIQYLSGVCHFIERLDASNCVKLTDRCLRFLRKGCMNLNMLTLLYCKGISKYGAGKMQSRMKGKVIHSTDETFVYLGNRLR